MMLILFMLLYFFIMGALFYKLFISSPPILEFLKQPEMEVFNTPKEYVKEPIKPKITRNEAADINVG